MLESKFSLCGGRACVVQVQSYAARNPQGWLSNAALDSSLRFENLTQLLLSMEALFDEAHTPQRSMATRRFTAEPPPEAPARPGGAPNAPPLASFRIDVLFRQNASWQGNLTWLETEQEAQFRSVLELVQLMDDALSAPAEQSRPA